MKHFIISDLHGNKQIYDSIINYLNNRKQTTEEEIILHINGDLIDRGNDSGIILLDVYNRIMNNNSFQIDYLAGNHELMMYQALKSLKEYEKINILRNMNWLYKNGGLVTANYLQKNLSFKEKQELISFIANLKIYNKFEETIAGKQIVLVHAWFVNAIKYNKDLRIKNNTPTVEIAVWARKNDFIIPLSNGNKNYFTIIGHTPVNNEHGYIYNKKENILNIDGGSTIYLAQLYQQQNNSQLSPDLTNLAHFPLVEIDSENERLIILTFNDINEITLGSYLQDKKIIPIEEKELNKYRYYLNKNFKAKIKELK